MEDANSMDMQEKVPAKAALSPAGLQLSLAEYNTLRAEILQRIELQHQIISLAILAPGTVFAVGLQVRNAHLILLYPVLAMFLAAHWAQIGRRILEIALYIEHRIEKTLRETDVDWSMGWQTSMRLGVQRPFRIFLAARGIFYGTEVLAIIVGLLLGGFDLLTFVLLGIALVSVGLTAVFLRPLQEKDIRLIDSPQSQPARQISPLLEE